MKDIIPDDEFTKEIGKGIGEEVAKNFVGFIGDIIRPPSKEIGGIFADKVKLYRFKKQVKIVIEAKDFLEKNNIPLKKISLPMLNGILDNGSWEEDERLQDKWSSLLANSVNLGTNTDNYKTYISLLKELNPIEVTILEEFYSYTKNNFFTILFNYPSYLSLYSLTKQHNHNTEYYIALDNLSRLNLIKKKQIVTKKGETIFGVAKEDEVIDSRNEEFSLTFLGYNFVRSCKWSFTDSDEKVLRSTLRKYLKKIVHELIVNGDYDKTVNLIDRFNDECKKEFRDNLELFNKRQIISRIEKNLGIKKKNIKDPQKHMEYTKEKEEIILSNIMSILKQMYTN